MKKIWLLIVIIILLPVNILAFQITEIMFNPNGSDTGKEWIEIKLNSSDECINLTEYKLFEENINHNIYMNTSDVFCQYAIITSDINKFLQDYSDINYSNIEIYKSTFSLSNNGEYVAIKKGIEIIDDINYTLLVENIETIEGHSLEYVEENNLSFWRKSLIINGNPGDKIEESADSEDNTSENISINISLEPPLNYTPDNVSENHTINESTENITINNTLNNCNINLNIILKNISTIYENDVQIKFQNQIEKDNSTVSSIDNYSIEYWVEDLFGNIIKNKMITTNQDEKSFTPKIDEYDKILIIKNSLKSIECNVSNISNIYGEKIILIKNSKYSPAPTTISATKSSCQQSCPVCEAKSTESNTCFTPQNNSPLIKIINVCNTSKEIQKSISQNSFELGQTETGTINNNSNRSIAQTAGKATSMIIYESPNLKNRLYALIGFILVGLTCLGMIAYKTYQQLTLDTFDKDAESDNKSKR